MNNLDVKYQKIFKLLQDLKCMKKQSYHNYLDFLNQKNKNMN